MLKVRVTYEINDLDAADFKTEYQRHYGREPTRQELNEYFRVQCGLFARPAAERVAGMPVDFKITQCELLE